MCNKLPTNDIVIRMQMRKLMSGIVYVFSIGLLSILFAILNYFAIDSSDIILRFILVTSMISLVYIKTICRKDVMHIRNIICIDSESYSYEEYSRSCKMLRDMTIIKKLSLMTHILIIILTIIIINR